MMIYKNYFFGDVKDMDMDHTYVYKIYVYISVYAGSSDWTSAPKLTNHCWSFSSLMLRVSTCSPEYIYVY